MEAGRELDALVAEKVMGWVREQGFLLPPVGDPRRNWAAIWDEQGLPDWLPDYSFEIAAAWEVVERMKELTKYNGQTWSTRDPWISFCRELCGDDWFGHAFFHVTPRSICLAALKSLEAPEDKIRFPNGSEIETKPVKEPLNSFLPAPDEFMEKFKKAAELYAEKVQAEIWSEVLKGEKRTATEIVMNAKEQDWKDPEK